MDDLILQTRLASLEASLRKVQNLLGWMSKRQTELTSIGKLLSLSIDLVSAKLTPINEFIFQQKLRAIGQGNVSQQLKLAESAGYDLIELAGQNGNLPQARKKIASLSKLYARINDQDAQQYQDVLNRKAEELLGPLRALKARKEATPEVWQEYEATLHVPAQNLFADFSEFLAGLALRESGFDEDICEIADELLHSFQRSSRNDLLTIPIPHEIVMEVLQRIVRLSYPEWTLWSLPMVAYEFWRGYTSKSDQIRADFEKRSGGLSFDDATLCLGDAFATFNMGPAYAYYAFYLSLNPVQAFRGPQDSIEEPVASERAEVILGMLQWMSGQGLDNPWLERIRKLRDSWNAVAAGANSNPVELAAKVSDRVMTIASSIEAALRLSQPTLPFRIEQWPRVEILKGVLANAVAQHKIDPNLQMNEPVDPTCEIREIVNAAWLARLESPADIDRIAQEASSLCEHIVRERRESRQPGGPGLKMAAGPGA